MSKARANADATSQTYIENATAAQELSGTYSTERLYFNDSYQLTGDVTVTGHLALGSIADEDVVITQDSTERTITGSGTLEAGNVLQDTHRTSLTDMTGTLANSVQDYVTRLGTVTTGTFNGTLDSTTFSGNAGQRTAKVWARFSASAILASFNVSGFTDNGTGSYTIHFMQPTANANYAGSAQSQCWNANEMHLTRVAGQATTSCSFNHIYNNAYSDCDYNHLIIFGD